MKAPVFPVFSLKTYNNLVFIGGGGGNEHFGKKNGVVVLDETTYKDIAYLDTEDIILGICISISEISIEEDEEDENKIETPKDTLINSNDFCVYLSCRGTNNLYIVKYENDKLFLIKKIEKTVSSQIFNRHLIFISDKKIYTVYDVLKKPNRLTTKSKKNSSGQTVLNDTTQEEYIYTLRKSGPRILISREEGKTDIPDTWENFFISKKRIHKVTKEEKGHCFVYNGKKYYYEKEIGDIACTKEDKLVFYLKGNDSSLKIIDKTETTHEIKKITCMNIDDGEFISVGTGDGYGNLFKGDTLYCRKKLCDFPVIGISYKNGFFYFSSFNGLVNRKKAFNLTKTAMSILGILILLIAVGYGIYSIK
jgi:hypothetical protein